MLKKADKSKIVEEIVDKLRRQKIAIFSDFHGVAVAKAMGLRRLLKKSGSEYKVAKKTLFDRALEAAGLGFRTKQLKGEIGVAFGFGDEMEPARALVKFAKENETFRILGGILSGRMLSEKEVNTLARLPSRDAILSQLVGALSSPINGLATALNGNIRNLVVVIHKIKDKK